MPWSNCAAESQPSADPALVLSLAWIDAHVAMLASCVRQQQAEEGLLERGAILSTGEVIGRGEGAVADCGCLDARTAEQGEAEKADALLDKIAATPAQSLSGVVAKLAVLVREEIFASSRCRISARPWPICGVSHMKR